MDILPFLKGASVSFQKYIIDGLAELDVKNQGLGDGNNKGNLYQFECHEDFN